ncbi:MAG: YbaB/EbfC family nucleoid-associated protein [Elusimicrobiota bacterium]|jgi:DNA-binding protein YbaB|nr:YbaB/EbfC family nucleoid-associated protein [Elusimicrobiota bacterium]
MELFKMAKEAMQMKSKMGEIDKKLKEIVFDAEYKGVKIKANAKSEFLALEIPQDLLLDKAKAEKIILDAFNAASSKAQEKMAQTSKEMMSGLNIPGLK